RKQSTPRGRWWLYSAKSQKPELQQVQPSPLARLLASASEVSRHSPTAIKHTPLMFRRDVTGLGSGIVCIECLQQSHRWRSELLATGLRPIGRRGGPVRPATEQPCVPG